MRDDEYLIELGNRFPNLYNYRNGNNIPMGFIWGEIDNGWFGIIEELSEKLEALLNTLPQPARACVQVNQVKQKFGGLRYYYSVKQGFEDDFKPIMVEFNNAVTEAENKASETCEICGKTPAYRFGYAWIRTLCLTHKEEYLRNLLNDTIKGAATRLERGEEVNYNQISALAYATRLLKEIHHLVNQEKIDAGNADKS